MTPEEIILSTCISTVVKKIGPSDTVILLARYIMEICTTVQSPGCTIQFPFGETVTVDTNFDTDEISH